MRRLAALLLPLFGVALLAAAPATDWTRSVRQTAKGAFVIGNPAAPIRLVEYGSYTCSHCAAFSTESGPVLKGQMIRSGRVSLEYRHLIRDPADLGAAILARCAGVRGFAGASDMIFATQASWLAKVASHAQAHPDLTTRPLLAQARAFADASGLSAAMRARGLAPAAIKACFANKAEVDRITAMTGDAPIEVNSTPSFFINDKLQPPAGWEQLETTLRAQGAK